VASLPHKCQPPLPSARQHPSYGDCLEVKRECYQNCSVLGCVTQCSQSAAHSCEQFLQVQQIGYVANPIILNLVPILIPLCSCQSTGVRYVSLPFSGYSQSLHVVWKKSISALINQLCTVLVNVVVCTVLAKCVVICR